MTKLEFDWETTSQRTKRRKEHLAVFDLRRAEKRSLSNWLIQCGASILFA